MFSDLIRISIVLHDTEDWNIINQAETIGRFWQISTDGQRLVISVKS